MQTSTHANDDPQRAENAQFIGVASTSAEGRLTVLFVLSTVLASLIALISNRFAHLHTCFAYTITFVDCKALRLGREHLISVATTHAQDILQGSSVFHPALGLYLAQLSDRFACSCTGSVDTMTSVGFDLQSIGHAHCISFATT